MFILALVIASLAIIAIVIWKFLPRKGAVPEQSEKPSIAVLSFEDLSQQKDQEYFCDGLAEELINKLTRLENLQVSARTSSFSFKGKGLSIQEIGEKLKVDSILEGSLQKADKKLRIAVRLINTDNGYQIWSERYECDEGDIFDLQDEISLEILDNLKIELFGKQKVKLLKHFTENPEAYEFYLRGRHYFDKWTKEGFEKAIEYFQKAIDIDPEYAQVYAWLSDSYGWLWLQGDLAADEFSSLSTGLIDKALKIDDTIPEVHLALANKRLYFEWDWEGSESEFKRTIELNPSFERAHQDYAWYLMAMGRSAEAIAEAKVGHQLDPFSYPANQTLCVVYYYTRQYDQVISQTQHITELERDESWYINLARIYEQMGSYEDALAAHQQAMTLSGEPPEDMASLRRTYSSSGPKGYWMWWLERLKGQYENNAFLTAKIYAQLGNKDQAFVWLGKAYEIHDGQMFLLKVAPLLDPLRSDPRFEELLRRMNFPD